MVLVALVAWVLCLFLLLWFVFVFWLALLVFMALGFSLWFCWLCAFVCVLAVAF